MKPKYPRGSLERAVEYIKTKGKKKSKTRAYGILFFAFFYYFNVSYKQILIFYFLKEIKQNIIRFVWKNKAGGITS